jgi:hypothetical protein
VLLDRTEFAYVGDGEVQTHRYRLVRVLSERGRDASIFLLMGLGSEASKVKKLKGWNLRPDGEMEKLDSDNVVAIEKPGNSLGVGNTRTTGAVLKRVMKGSFVAFESLQAFKNPAGPSDIVSVMEPHPIFRWELAAAKREGWFTNLKDVKVLTDLRHFSPWIGSLRMVADQEVSADNIPALPKDESEIPWFWDALPRVQIRFADPSIHDAPGSGTWGDIAAWTEDSFQKHATPCSLPGLDAARDEVGLRAIAGWMSRELAYKQVYLTPERDLVPMDASEVVRRRYGDCKDLASCFIAAARAAGFKAYPTLARIIEGHIAADEPVFLGAFNHVIAAVHLEKPLGLPSEVDTEAGHFLLVDPTARLTPLGFLPDAHRAGRVMICAGRKGVWVAIPDSAIERKALRMKLEATVEPDGRLNGKLHIEESGDAAGLRGAALDLTAKDLNRHILDHLVALPADGTLEVQSHGDPLDLSKALSMEVRFVHPHGVVRSAHESDLDALGIFRVLPAPIQPAGKPRLYPIEQTGSSLLEVRAEVQFPYRVSPVLPGKALRGPFRDLDWSAKTVPDGSGSIVSLELASRLKPVYFGFGEQKAGMDMWLKYRRESRDFLDDALAFKAVP